MPRIKELNLWPKTDVSYNIIADFFQSDSKLVHFLGFLMNFEQEPIKVHVKRMSGEQLQISAKHFCMITL